MDSVPTTRIVTTTITAQMIFVGMGFVSTHDWFEDIVGIAFAMQMKIVRAVLRIAGVPITDENPFAALEMKLMFCLPTNQNWHGTVTMANVNEEVVPVTQRLMMTVWQPNVDSTIRCVFQCLEIVTTEMPNAAET